MYTPFIDRAEKNMKFVFTHIFVDYLRLIPWTHSEQAPEFDVDFYYVYVYYSCTVQYPH